jgi:hypothetical protein
MHACMFACMQKVKASLPVPKENVLVLPFDLCGGDEAIEKAAALADAAFGGAGVDYLIHNAGQSVIMHLSQPALSASTLSFSPPGASQHAMAEDVKSSITAQMFALNTLGPIMLTRAALPHMLERRKGRFVVIASMAAKVPSPGQAIYTGEKAQDFPSPPILHPDSAPPGCLMLLSIPSPPPSFTPPSTPTHPIASYRLFPPSSLQDGLVRLLLLPSDRGCGPRGGRDHLLPGPGQQRVRRPGREIRLWRRRDGHSHRGAKAKGQGPPQEVSAPVESPWRLGLAEGGSFCGLRMEPVPFRRALPP